MRAWSAPLSIGLTLLLLGTAGANAYAAVYAYMTLHNLGCRQANHSYTGYIPNAGFSEGDLIQIVLAGPNRHADVPLADGSPGGDDQVALNPGLPVHMNPESFTHYPNTFYSSEAILIQDSGFGTEPALRAGVVFYVRAWNATSPLRATMYFNSAALTRDYPMGYEVCPVDSAVRTLTVPPSILSLITYAVVFDAGHLVAPANVVVLSPNGGEAWAVGDSMDITWNAVPAIADMDLLLSRDNGTTWNLLLSRIQNTGTCRVAVQEPAADQCLVSVRFAADTSLFDASDGSFAITGDLPPPEVLIHADSSQVRLFWQPAINAMSYIVERSEFGLSWNSVLSTADTSCVFPFDSLSNGNRGFYRVRSHGLPD